MATNLYDYYTGQGKTLPTVQQRTADATKAGISGYTGTADQNNTLLKYLSSNQSAVGPSTAVQTPAAQQYIQSQTQAPAQTPQTAPQTPSAKDAYIQAYKAYIDGQKQDEDVTNAKTAYNDYMANITKSVAGKEGRGLGIPLQIVRGEQERLLKQTQPEANRLQSAIGIAEGSQTNKLNGLKLGVDLQSKLMELDQKEQAAKTAQEKEAYQRKRDSLVEQRLANPAFELSAGQTRYQTDPATGEYKAIASMPAKPTALPVAKTVTSGTLKYTAKDQAEDTKALEQSRGQDGYVDPTIYQNLYKEWIANGGLLKDFLTRYPPKSYVNPKNTWLQPFLMPTTKSGTTINDL